jgi:hypothetical protein
LPAARWNGRLYRFENLLPGPLAGVFGYMMGFNALKWLGFAGSGLIGICLFVLGAAMVFGFSWGKLAEGLGAPGRHGAVWPRASRNCQGCLCRQESGRTRGSGV